EKDLSIGGYRTVSTPVPEVDKSIGGIRTVSGKESATTGANSSGRIIKDRYELNEEIGRGGFAVVYKGLDKKLNRVIAVKVLSPQAGLDNATVERFQRESSIIASLNHRNILAVYDCDLDADAGYFIVMEYIEGGTLRDYLKSKGKLSIEDTVALMRGICKGMSYAHRKNLVHRDLKPANIMLTGDGDELVPKIVDFGLARSGGSSEVSISGYGMGTPYYMPPEQRRDAKSVNHTADIYAIGKVFYEMLTGEIPDNVDTEKLPSECQMLNRIITKCVKSKPEERYFSVDELLAEIEKVMSSFGKESAIEKQPVTRINVCPQCSTSNKAETKFCAKCGTGLTRKCPECDVESSIHDGHCPSCGADIELFLKASTTLGSIEKYMSEKKWSRVVKERSLLPEKIILKGKKGVEILGKIKSICEDAENKQKKTKSLNDEIGTLTRRNDFSSALILVDELVEITEDKTSIEELKMSVLRGELLYRNNLYLKNIESGLYQEALLEGTRLLEIIPQLKADKIEGIEGLGKIGGSLCWLKEKVRLIEENKCIQEVEEKRRKRGTEINVKIEALTKKNDFNSALEFLDELKNTDSDGINIEDLRVSVLADELIYRNDLYLKNIDSGLYQEALQEGKRILEIIPLLKGEKIEGIEEIEESVNDLEQKLDLLGKARQSVKGIRVFKASRLIKQLYEYPELKKETANLKRGNLLRIYATLFTVCLVVFLISLYFSIQYINNKQLSKL
ncbi:MAG: protein kinase, partial [Lentisphaerota bacterium]